MDESALDSAPAVVPDKLELSHDSLLKLLAYLEGEVEARDVVIETLRAEKARLLLHEARYGVARNDPYRALRDDAVIQEDPFDDAAVARAFQSQFTQLERLIRAHKRSHERSKLVLATTEKIHRKTIEQLEGEKERASKDAAEGDDVAARVERQRAKLAQMLDYQVEENNRLKDELQKAEKLFDAEKERHKAMVLFLIDERKQMLLKIHELRVKSEANSSLPTEDTLVGELKKELTSVRQERDTLRSTIHSLQIETVSLREALRSAETRRSGYAGSAPFPTEERSLVVTNRAATSRLPSSSSFPTERSGISQPTRVPMRTSTTLVARPPASPVKKLPIATSGMATMRPKATKKHLEPEIEQLEAAIQSIGSRPSSTVKRSSSLPRGRIESRASNAEAHQRVSVQKTETRTSSAYQPQPSPAEKSTSASQNGKNERKISGTVKRNGLLKAFGVSSKNEK